MKLNSWNNIMLFCGNHGEDHSIQMQLVQGPHSLFYACPCYRDKRPGKACNNRLNLIDYDKMLSFLNEKSEGNGFEDVNLTGYRFKMKGISFEVLEHDGEKFKVLMLNRKAIRR